VVAVLFILAAMLLGALIFFGMIGSDMVPRTCPKCALGKLAWEYRAGGKPIFLRCDRCPAAFREHPNGSLVDADRDP